ncbi:Ank domain-containing protein/Ank_2 domain-containing protein [Cephalotus follicularis]|uniref:Ank domain-containing protein/Ank_2 domain-containing protein n=1 Tax=Cephalotus follicularis TaxID=3775 RepID=A0A1Q3B361_CEPFO|nr:Ank domain-containing protein/Ank_2 domain-containing protein [Cephalotus follicularis]
MPPPPYFPLRWESTGDQWWYASPIDWAAANGLYDLVSELLHLDTNLLIKLTSLRRIRRLETVWDDEENFSDVAKCRSYVARKLLLECNTKTGHNTLIRAGYGGWLLYTASSAGDVNFVKELLKRDPFLVFGEGEYGITDIFYAAARSKNSEVFRLLLDYSVSPRCSTGGEMEEWGENDSVFKREMMNRAVHAAARGGNWEILKELLGECGDVLVYRDMQGSSILHTASGRGQVEVVKDLIASFDIITSTDNQGNTALHVAAYRGHLAVVEMLILSCPLLTYVKNIFGDTFLHMAVAGFQTPGFRRVDRQIELMKQLLNGKIPNILDVINVRNNDGKTALHLAVVENIQSKLVELLMTAPAINLNIQDANGMTPLEILKQRPKSTSSEILIKQLISAGGVCRDIDARSSIISHLKGHGIGGSPGTSFRIPDAEIFLYTGIENTSDASVEDENDKCLSELSDFDSPISSYSKKPGSVNYAARHLKFLLRWTTNKERKGAGLELGDDDSLESFSICKTLEDNPIPLRQRYSKSLPLPNNKGTFSVKGNFPSPLTRKKFTAGLTHGVIKTVPQQRVLVRPPPSPFSESSVSSISHMDKKKGIDIAGKSHSIRSFDGNSPHVRQRTSPNKKAMNQYFCFGAQGMAVGNSISDTQPNHRYKYNSSVAA